MEIFKHLQNTFYDLSKDYDVVHIFGEDVTRFLNGQLTNDVAKLEQGSFQLQARLDRGGKLQSFCYLLKEDDKNFYAIVPTSLTGSFREDLEKFIIMDDVSFEGTSKKAIIVFSAYADANKHLGLEESFSGTFGHFPAFMSFNKKNLASALTKSTFERLMVLQGEPIIDINVQVGGLVTDTVVNLSGVSLEKGCFLGQETVAKIETRRGGAYFPVILNGREEHVPNFKIGEVLKVNDKKSGSVLWSGNGLQENDHVVIASLLRDYRVKGRTYTFLGSEKEYEAMVSYVPYEEVIVGTSLTDHLFENAVKTFQEGKDKEAITQFEEILKIDPKNEDSFEAIGVIFGRLEKYDEGIRFMDMLLEANPNSVMAHTNKSLYYMRIGEIEKAEEEKAQATVKSFSKLGEEAQNKKKIDEMKKQEEAEINRRYEMFQQVIEIDPDDALANYGLADIYFHRNEPSKSVELLEKVLHTDSKYSVAYLLLGKALIADNRANEAKEIFEKGIVVASSKGDLMPANEMQTKLLELNS